MFKDVIVTDSNLVGHTQQLILIILIAKNMITKHQS